MQILADYRALHRIPELDKTLPKTVSYLKSALQGLKCRVFSPVEGAVCAWFDCGKREAIAFRSDMDALPLGEGGQAFHGCGHDGHMAMILELARFLSGRSLGQNVLLVFQPAEETTGGARDICQTGIFQSLGVRAIFGMHLWPGLPAGEIFSRPGPMMARSCQVDVEILGKGGHIAASGPDAVLAAARIVSQAAIETSVGLMKFGLLQGGTACNAIPPGAKISGSLRAMEEAFFEAQRQNLLEIAAKTEKSTGCQAAVRFSGGYPAVENPVWLYEKARQTVDFGKLEAGTFLSEDFSWYQKVLPGLFFFLGAGDGPALHSPDFHFPEEILLSGAAFWQKLAQNWDL